MSIVDRTIGKCAWCGIEFERERISKQYHSDACRKAANRAKKAKEQFISDNLSIAIEAIINIGHSVEINELSYDAIIALRNLRSTLNFYDVAKASSWWRCKKCWVAVQKELPSDDDCNCDDKPQWELQKTML